MKKLKSAAFILLLFSMLLVPVVRAPVLEGWKYSKILTFDDGWAGLQVTFNVTYGAASNGVNFNSQEDFDDLRFYDLYTGVLLAAWNQTTVSGEYVIVWLKLDESLSVIMYYGEDSAEPYWNQAAVFVDVIDGVVLGLPIDENSGNTVYDYSGYDNDGTITGASWVDGKYGKALSFDGTNYARTSTINFPFGNNPRTVTIWLNTTSEAVQVIFTYGVLAPNQSCTLYSIGGIVYVAFNSNDYALIDISDGYYNFVIFTFDGEHLKAWVNENLVLNTTTVISTTETDTLYIGEDINGGYKYTGIIDEVCIYNQALTETEIENVYGDAGSHYGDVTLEEGSCLVRVWVDIMPVVSFGSEVSRDYASRGEFLAAALIVSVICVPLLLLVIWSVRKRS